MGQVDARHVYAAKEWASNPTCAWCGKTEDDADHLPHEYVAGRDDWMVSVGDLREGTGTHHPLVRVLAMPGGYYARCLLVRSGKEKSLKVRTLSEKYRLIERSREPGA